MANPIAYLQVENLTKSFGDLVLFKNMSFGIAEGQRVALIAKNGTGKSTLLNILFDKEDVDSGTVTYRRDLKLGYLEQDPVFPEHLTVLEACFHSGNEVVQTIERYESFMYRETHGLAHPKDETLDGLLNLMDLHKAWDFEVRIKQILQQLKIVDFEQPIGQLSGDRKSVV